jgi:hypothetical protein
MDENDSRKIAAFQNFLAAQPLMRAILKDVADERYAQLEKWGVQRHENAGYWLSILGEEFGEVCEAAGPVMGLGTRKESDADDLYTELIQVAAVAIAWAEQLAEGGRGYESRLR